MPIPLNPSQKKAQSAPLNPLLVVAGAGTGKTRVLTSRLLYLIEKGVDPEAITAITFTNKAAKEMAARVLPVLQGKKIPSIGTFHSLGARLLRKECRRAGRTPNFIIFDDSDSFSLLKKTVKESGQAQKLGAAFFRKKIQEIKDGTLALDPKGNLEDELVENIFKNYEEALKANNAFDFDDLIQKPVSIFKKFPEVLKKYEKGFSHILVDEYQDVSSGQYEFIKLIGEDSKSITFVGDSDQTIYSWRGSDINIFLGFEKDWPKSQIVFLEENYRSTQTIIDAASYLINHNLERPKIARDNKLRAVNSGGDLIKIFEAASPETEAEWISSQIENSDMDMKTAILYRTNAQSRALEQALLGRGIPYIIFGGLKFYERREIKDILAGLRFISNSLDSVSEERLQKTFKKRVFSGIRGKLLAQNGLSPVDVIRFFLKITDYFAYMDAELTNAPERRENIAELMRFAAEFQTLPEFLEQVTLLQATDQTARENRENAVHLMTIHLAKGLEFDRVFLAGTTEGILPHARSLTQSSELEEERRLMYVAMTRARKKLFLSFYDLPSRFLNELPGDCTAFESEVSNTDKYEDSDEKYITLD